MQPRIEYLKVRRPAEAAVAGIPDDMQPRIEYLKVAPGAYKAMSGVEQYVRHCGLEPVFWRLHSGLCSARSRTVLCS
jgi:hypothetical protein